MARQERTITRQGIPVLRRVQRPNGQDWTCSGCGKLLGRIIGHDVHIRLQRRHEYVASLPVSATCKGCRTLNRVRKAAAA